MVRLKRSYGVQRALNDIFPVPIVASRTPTTSDKRYPLGQVWIYTTTGQIYMLASVVSGSATWSIMGPGASDVDTVQGDSGGAISPTAGNVVFAGGTNLTTVGSSGPGTITFNLDAAISLATSVTSPIYTTSAANMNINSAANQDIIMQMGDAVAGNKISFEDSASAEVASLDSDGTLTVVNMDGIIGATTPAAGTFTTIGGTTITASVSNVSPLYTAGAGADTVVEAVAGQDIVLNMSTNDGSTNVLFTDSDDATVFSVDSNGTVSTFNGLVNTGAFTTSGGAASINASSNFNTVINSGTSTGTVTIGNGAAGAITIDSGAGISLDAAASSNFTLSAGDLTISSAGGIDFSSSEAASSTGLTFTASAADGGMTFDAGSGGILIGVSADCTPISIGDVVPTSARTITLGGGTVATAIADTIDIGPDGVDTDAGASKVVTINNGGVTLGTLTTNVASGAITSGTHTVNIQSGNAAGGTAATNLSTGTGTKTVNLGNADANTTFNIDAVTLINDSVNANTSINTGSSTGTVTIGNVANSGAWVGATSSTMDLDAAGQIQINSSGSTIDIGNDAVSQNINLGTAGARTVTVGNTTGASSVVVDVGTGNASFGASATAHTTTIGSTTGASDTIIQSGSGDITVTGTVKEIGAEFLSQSGIYIPNIKSQPLMCTADNGGGVPTGATGDLNLMYLQEGVLMQQFILGAGQTIIVPTMTNNGLDIALDNAASEGAEYNFGGTSLTAPEQSFIIGTAAPFFFEVGLYINDMDGAAPYVIGFRKTEVNNATFDAYTDYATIGMIAASSVTNVVTATEVNSGGQTVTDTTDAWGGDGSTNTLRVLVDGSGNVTYTINGSAPSASAAFQFDNTDVVVPFIRITHSANPTSVAITSIKCGFQA